MTTTPHTPGSEIPASVQPPGEMPTTPPGTGEIPGTTTPQALSIDAALKEIERLKADIKKVHAESAGHRKKADELDRLKAEAEAATLNETQKLQKQLAALQAEKEQATIAAQELRISSSIQLQALTAGIDPTLAAKLIDRADIEFDDTGAPKNMDAVLKALIKQYPILDPKLTGRQAAAGGATNPPRSTTSGSGAITREFVENMTNQQYAQLSPAQRAEVQQVIQGGRSPFGQRAKH